MYSSRLRSYIIASYMRTNHGITKTKQKKNNNNKQTKNKRNGKQQQQQTNGHMDLLQGRFQDEFWERVGMGSILSNYRSYATYSDRPDQTV